MSETPQLILHVGAPKCGSSALQSALSLAPDLTTAAAGRLRYTAWQQIGRFGQLLQGQAVTGLARGSPYGYVSWPNMRPEEVDAPVFAALDRLRRKGLRQGYVPIASCEGWITRASLFATHLARWGYPPVEVVAFLRPVVDWTNSAFWQWGVWNVRTMDQWLARSNIPYSFGADLEAWSQIPNVHLRFAWSQPDAVARFAQWQGVTLPMTAPSNTSSSPALIGVLLRNRRLRPNGHDASTEFVVQRWCPPVPGRKPWAMLPQHIRSLRDRSRATVEALSRIAVTEEEHSLCGDPRWRHEKPYHRQIRAGLSPLNDPDQLAQLHGSLCAGVRHLADLLETAAPDLPACPSAGADLKDWDRVLVTILDALLAADGTYRLRAVREHGGLSLRLRTTLSRMHAQLLAKRSR